MLRVEKSGKSFKYSNLITKIEDKLIKCDGLVRLIVQVNMRRLEGKPESLSIPGSASRNHKLRA